MLSDAEMGAPNQTGRREKRADGNNGLYLLVTPTGRKSWAVAYRYDGQSRTLPLGGYPGVTPAEARYRAEQVRAALDRGEDPGVGSKRAVRQQAAVDRARRFDAVAELWFKRTVEPRRGSPLCRPRVGTGSRRPAARPRRQGH